MRQGNKVILRMVMVVLIVYAVLILNNQLENILQSLDSLYDLLANSRLLRM